MNKGEKRQRAEFDILGRIKAERDRRNWSDYELAEKSGISQSTLSTWFNRDIEPGVASIEKICHGLGISLSQFFMEAPDYLTKEQRDYLDLMEKVSPEIRESVLHSLFLYTVK